MASPLVKFSHPGEPGGSIRNFCLSMRACRNCYLLHRYCQPVKDTGPLWDPLRIVLKAPLLLLCHQTKSRSWRSADLVLKLPHSWSLIVHSHMDLLKKKKKYNSMYSVCNRRIRTERERVSILFFLSPLERFDECTCCRCVSYPSQEIMVIYCRAGGCVRL